MQIPAFSATELSGSLANLFLFAFDMDASISPVTILRLSSPSRILSSSCCPDKDLVLLISRHVNKDIISLWKIQGGKRWELEVDVGHRVDQVMDIAWAPDGQTIALAHNPPRITIHSIHDGHLERSFPVHISGLLAPYSFQLLRIWWFGKEPVVETKGPIPDIFKRDGVITGSSQSVLKMFPLLDPPQDDGALRTANPFLFQTGPARTELKSTLPETISSWPTLPSSLSLASIQSAAKAGPQSSRPGEELDEVDHANIDSILAVANDVGHIHYYLDAAYPLGHVSMGGDFSVVSLEQGHQRSTFFAHLETRRRDVGPITRLRPTVVDLPLLETRHPRDIASASSAARELVWYAKCAVKEMRESWFGSDAHAGARELGPKWIRALESRQKEQFGQDEPNAILDLTALLATGRPSEALADFLGSNEQMSDRGMQKWESTVVDSFTKLRDFSEKRLAPACQRLHLVLEEVHGWSLLPQQYGLFGFKTSDVEAILDLTARAIISSAWLTATARREVRRFKEFIAWIRHENNHINQSGDSAPPPRHDFLEVNNYLMSGLVVSPIDKWFMGPVPQFSSQDLGIAPGGHDLEEVMERARRVIDDPGQVAWKQGMKYKDLSHLDRNLDSLVEDLSVRCQRLFWRAAYATGQSATISHSLNSSSREDVRTTLPKVVHMRERTIRRREKGGGFLHYVAMQTPPIADTSFLFLARTHYKHDVSETALHVEVAMLECLVPGEGQSQDEGAMRGTVLDFEFFDEEDLVVVYRHGSLDTAVISLVNYSGVDYQDLKPDGYVNAPLREDLMVDALQQWRDKQLRSVPMPIKRCRALAGCKQGKISLAVNGRAGRRTACVLDHSGLNVEVMDMEGEPEETDEAEPIEAETEE